MTGLENLHLNLRSERVKENGWDSANISNQKKRDVFFFFFNITEPQTLTRRFVSTFLTKPFGIFPRPDLLHCEFYDLTSKHFPCVFSHIFTAHTRNSLTRASWKEARPLPMKRKFRFSNYAHSDECSLREINWDWLPLQVHKTPLMNNYKWLVWGTVTRSWSCYNMLKHRARLRRYWGIPLIPSLIGQRATFHRGVMLFAQNGHGWKAVDNQYMLISRMRTFISRQFDTWIHV